MLVSFLTLLGRGSPLLHLHYVYEIYECAGKKVS